MAFSDVRCRSVSSGDFAVRLVNVRGRCGRSLNGGEMVDTGVYNRMLL